MDVLVKIGVEGANPADIHREAASFSRLAATQADLNVSRPEDSAPEPGQRGAGIELGTVLVALVTSGALTALINVVKTYFDRDRSVVLTIENPDGRKVEIKAENVKPDRLRETIAAVQGVLEGSS